MRGPIALALRPCPNVTRLQQLDQKVLFSFYNSAPRHSRIYKGAANSPSSPSSVFGQQSRLIRPPSFTATRLSPRRLCLAGQIRPFASATRLLKQAPTTALKEDLRETPTPVIKEEKNTTSITEDEEDEGFKRSEKANQASQIDLSARLSREGASSGKGQGFWRDMASHKDCETGGQGLECGICVATHFFSDHYVDTLLDWQDSGHRDERQGRCSRYCRRCANGDALRP